MVCERCGISERLYILYVAFCFCSSCEVLLFKIVFQQVFGGMVKEAILNGVSVPYYLHKIHIILLTRQTKGSNTLPNHTSKEKQQWENH